MLILFLRRVKRNLLRVYHNFKMAHGHVKVIHQGLGSYQRYVGGGKIT